MAKPRTQELVEIDLPTACPFCRSPRILTAGERVDSSSYWRCEACGQMWNVDRLRAPGRYPYDRR
jgi:transposase-like protein